MFYKWKKSTKKCLLTVLSVCMIGTCIPLAHIKTQADETAAVQNQEGNQEQTTENNVNNMTSISAETLTYCITLDPGHGGKDSGANGVNSSEKRLNLLIGKYLKEELEKYENVRVVMTRDKDVFVNLHKRIIIAQKNNADLMISLHNDSWDQGLPYDNGCSVLVAKKGSYRPEMITQEVRLGRNILSELKGIGLKARGFVRKKSARVPEYEDGSKGDYHAIIRDGMRTGIPSILIEHAFCDSKHDYKHFLKTEEQLRSLAAADARGIARFLQLRRKDTGEVLPPVEEKGKKQVCSSDASAYYTLAQKRYYNELYYSMLSSGTLRHASNQNIAAAENKASASAASGEVLQSADQLEQMKEMEQAAMIKAAEIQDKNEASGKKVPYVILWILAGFGLVVLIREVEFGFNFSIQFRIRGNQYDDWGHWETSHNFDRNRTGDIYG